MFKHFVTYTDCNLKGPYGLLISNNNNKQNKVRSYKIV